MKKYLLFLQSNQLPGLGPKNSISFSSLRVPKAFILALSLSKDNSYLLAPRRLRTTKGHLSTRRTVVTKRKVHNNFDEWRFPYIRNEVLRQNNIKLLVACACPRIFNFVANTECFQNCHSSISYKYEI